MTGITPEHDLLQGTATAVPPAAKRSDQPASILPLDEPDSSDTTTILYGATANFGRASWSAMRVAQTNDVMGLYEADRKVRLEREAEERRELEHRAIWNAQMTVVGGVSMTNDEAQQARRHVLTNADVYADRAIANGDIKESERAGFKRWMARKIELEDKRGRGTITDAEAKEEADGDRTNVGHAADGATGADHQAKGASVSATAPLETANAALRHEGHQALADYDLFQAKAASPPAVTNEKVAPASVPVLATGLNL